jgi:glutamyl-tRNA synthetase
MIKLKANAQSSVLLGALSVGLKQAATWDDAGITAAVTAVAAEHKVKAGALMPLLRFSMSGQTRGPDVKIMMGILGKERSLARIERLIGLL